MRLIQRCAACVLLVSVYFIGRSALGSETEVYPEQSDIHRILEAEKPEGVVFLVMEQDEEALRWVLPRVRRYTEQLRAKWGELSIVLLSHGDEMFALRGEARGPYKEIHEAIISLVTTYDIWVQVCGAYAYLSDVEASDFPDYVDVVPSAPAEIDNYRLMGYQMVNLELTW